MDTDRIKGIGKQIEGSIKETFGKVTGDTKTEAEGAAEKLSGKAENAVGGVKDEVRRTVTD